MTTTYGFKAMNAYMTCRGYQFEVGKTYQINNEKPLELCSESGFHFCLNFEDVFNYYAWHSSRVFKVKTETDVLTEEDKSITKEITILEEVTQKGLNYNNLVKDDAKLFYQIGLEKDEKLIFKTFKDDNFWEVRRAVVNKLSDENLISYFKDDEDCDVREAVVNKLSDEKLIYSFKDDEHWLVREAVVERLSDEKLIYSFEDDKDWAVRLAVVNKLSDEKLISSFEDDEDCDVRKAVVEKLSDEKLIYSFKDDVDLDIRRAAIKKLEELRSPY